jgi:hypothetical protein
MFHLKGQSPKYGGQFNNELDAAKKVNELCKNFGVSHQNPKISAIPNCESCQVTKSFVDANFVFGNS